MYPHLCRPAVVHAYMVSCQIKWNDLHLCTLCSYSVVALASLFAGQALSPHQFSVRRSKRHYEWKGLGSSNASIQDGINCYSSELPSHVLSSKHLCEHLSEHLCELNHPSTASITLLVHQLLRSEREED